MEIKVKELLDAVKKAGQVVKSKSTIPIIENVLIYTKGDRIFVRGTDLENTISCNFDYSEEWPTVAVEPKKLGSMLASIKTEMILVEFVEGLMTIKSGKTKFNLPTMDGADFPAVDDVNDIKTLGVIEREHIGAMDTAAGYVGTDELRPVMMSVALFSDKSLGRLNVVATDAHKLVEYKMHFAVEEESEKPLLVPGVSIKLLKKTFNKEITVRYNKKNVFFSEEGVSMFVRQVDGKFPNYEAVIPKDNPVSMTFDKDELMEALSTVGITLNMANTIKLDIGRMDALISAEDLDFNYGSVVPLGVLYEGQEDHFVMGLNHRFLTKIIKDIDANEIKVEGSTPTRAMVIHNSTDKYDLTSLIMPVMLTN